MKTLKNKLLEYERNRQKHLARFLSLDSDLHPQAASPDSAMAGVEEDGESVWSTIREHLTEEEQSILRRIVWEGAAHLQVAKERNISVYASQKRLQRIRENSTKSSRSGENKNFLGFLSGIAFCCHIHRGHEIAGQQNKYAYLDQWSTEQLEELLRTDAASRNSGTVEVISYILKVMEQREQASPTGRLADVPAAWEEFQRYYNIPEGSGQTLYPRGADRESAGLTPTEKAGGSGKPRRPRRS